MVVSNGCRQWLSATAVSNGCQQWLSAVAVSNGCQEWLSAMAVSNGCQQWLSAMAVSNGCQQWLSAMVVSNGCQQWLSAEIRYVLFYCRLKLHAASPTRALDFILGRCCLALAPWLCFVEFGSGSKGHPGQRGRAGERF